MSFTTTRVAKNKKQGQAKIRHVIYRPHNTAKGNMMKSMDEEFSEQEQQTLPHFSGQQSQDNEYYSSLEQDGFDEETVNGNSTVCVGDHEEITGSRVLRMKDLRLTLLCWCFSIKFFQMTLCAAFTLIAIQWDEVNEFITTHFWTTFISSTIFIASYYSLKHIRSCRRFPINLLLLIIVTIFMALTFSALAVHVWPFSYTILVAEITCATNFFMMIPYALCLKVDENGYRMYKHMAVTTVAVVIFSQPPYFLSISPRYNVEYGIYMLNVCLGAVLGAVLGLEGFYLFKRQMNSGRLTSLANLEGIFSASVS